MLRSHGTLKYTLVLRRYEHHTVVNNNSYAVLRSHGTLKYTLALRRYEHHTVVNEAIPSFNGESREIKRTVPLNASLFT